MSIKETLKSTTDLVIVLGAEETKLAWQWAESTCRIRTLHPVLKEAFAFEGMATEAWNWRHPYNRVQLCNAANEPYIDAFNKKLNIQFKNSRLDFYQEYGVNRLPADKPGKVIVPKGCKTFDSSLVEESPISKSRLARASEAVARADSLGRLALRGALIGAATGAGITAVFQAKKLYKKQISGKQYITEVAKEAGFGAVSGAAVTLFGVAVASAAAPTLVVIGGGIVTGAVARYGAEKLVDRICK